MSILEHEQTSQGQEAPVEVNWEERYKNLQSYHDKTRVGLESEIQRLRKASTVFTPPKTPEELEAFKAENPDWMGVIQTVAHQMTQESVKPIQEQLRNARVNEAAARVRAAHPDVYEITQSEQFQTWANDQGPDIQAWLQEEEDAEKVIRALNYYKAMTRPVQATQPVHQDPTIVAARHVGTRGVGVNPEPASSSNRIWKASEIQNMPLSEYEKYQKEIEQAYREGRVRR